MKQKRDVTIYDIAKMLDLSSATVSRGLHNQPGINKNTVQKIKAAAKELGYRHNTFASSLRKQQTNTIGVLVHKLNSQFVTSVLAGIEKVATAAGYDLLIAHSSESYEKEVANALNLFHKRVDGLIASLAFDTGNIDHYKAYEDKGIPVIFFDRVEESCNNMKVVIDNYKCGYLATQHLIDRGCKNIVLATGNIQRNVYGQRHRGYIDALFDNGLVYRENHVLIKDLGEESGVDIAMEMLNMDPLPDGLFIINDFSAAVSMQTLKEHGIRIPEDIAIVGFNNDAIGRFIDPQLTTIDYPGIDMGEIAASHLINHFKGIEDVRKSKTIVIPSRLIIRKSSLR